MIPGIDIFLSGAVVAAIVLVIAVILPWEWITTMLTRRVLRRPPPKNRSIPK